jgi:hypothetical protein
LKLGGFHQVLIFGRSEFMKDNLEYNGGTFARRWFRQDEPETGDRDRMNGAKCHPPLDRDDRLLEDEPERFVAFCE